MTQAPLTTTQVAAQTQPHSQPPTNRPTHPPTHPPTESTPCEPFVRATAHENHRAAADRILQLGKRLRRAKMIRTRGHLWQLRASLLAPLRGAREALHAVRTYGDNMASVRGVSKLRQFVWSWWVVTRHGFHTSNIYRYQLFDRARVLPRPMFIEWEDASLLFRALTPLTDAAAAVTLADKRTFATWCARHELPAPRTLAEFVGGRLVTPADTEPADPRVDLFAKFASGMGGEGTRCWRYSAGRYTEATGEVMDFADIVASLKEMSRDDAVLLQPRLVNHHELSGIAPSALATVRLMTTRRPNELPRFLAGALRMGRAGATADNFAQGGIASPIDARTGVLDSARWVDDKYCTHIFDSHPDTGAPIKGRVLSRWQETIELARRAHTLVGDIPCIGWDIAHLDDGLVILEGNWSPCTKFLQVVTELPVLSTEFSVAHAAWLNTPQCQITDDWLLQQESWRPVPLAEPRRPKVVLASAVTDQ